MVNPEDSLQRCDCLNMCGDDSRVAKGLARKCEDFDRLRRDEHRQQACAELCRQLRKAATAELLANGLAGIIREYPSRRQAATELLELVHAAGGNE